MRMPSRSSRADASPAAAPPAASRRRQPPQCGNGDVRTSVAAISTPVSSSRPAMHMMRAAECARICPRTGGPLLKGCSQAWEP